MFAVCFIRMGKGPILCLGGDIPQMWGLPTQLPPCPKPFIWGKCPHPGIFFPYTEPYLSIRKKENEYFFLNKIKK